MKGKEAVSTKPSRPTKKPSPTKIPKPPKIAEQKLPTEERKIERTFSEGGGFGGRGRKEVAPEERTVLEGRRISFAVLSFTGCNGCLSTLMCDPIFFSLLKDSDFHYFPLVLDPPKSILEPPSAPRGKRAKSTVKESALKDGLVVRADLLADIKELKNIDIAIIEGSIYAEEHVRVAELLRNKTKVVIALGTCACFGGITSHAQETLHLRNQPLKNVINVDDFIPGCPPTSNSIGNAIVAVSRGETILHSPKSLCEDCPLKTEVARDRKFYINRLRPKHNEHVTQCFLTKEILCLGPVTRAGCGHRCILAGQPCDGCFGSVKGEFVANIVNFLATMNVALELKEYNSIFFKYSHPQGVFPLVNTWRKENDQTNDQPTEEV
ncbi:MAG: NADH ubiquinone oxidoreductase 20 kDa subunit [Promethearchaeota archaeon CR_4]|nr:MAG: NADH ubiquinone oxidoreductase 20 kDa subunit [Candidatus Lokiarchaeota archaeon CR_4]